MKRAQFESKRLNSSGNFGDLLSGGFELVATPVVFFFIGYLIDNYLHTYPYFSIGLLVFAISGTIVRIFYASKAEKIRQQKGESNQKYSPLIVAMFRLSKQGYAKTSTNKGNY